MKKLLTISVLLCVASFADQPAVHGMLLFGNKTSYVSHLPMFHKPHDYQLVATVELAEFEGGKILAKYETAKKSNIFFTIVPKPMDLSEIIAGRKTSFEVTIFKGHFERGGTEIGPAVVTIKQILIGDKIAKNRGSSADFLAFGGEGEYYLAHVIKGQPTYDAVYRASAPTKLFFPTCERAPCPEPINIPVSDHDLPMTLKSNIPHFGSKHPQNEVFLSTSDIRIEVRSPFYVEYDELAH